MKIGLFAFIIFWATCFAAWVTAVVYDIIASDVLWVVVDILLSPVGVIRGFLYWFGAI